MLRKERTYYKNKNHDQCHSLMTYHLDRSLRDKSTGGASVDVRDFIVEDDSLVVRSRARGYKSYAGVSFPPTHRRSDLIQCTR